MAYLDLHEVRERVHRKALGYFEPFENRDATEQRRLVFGALDALLDASEGIASYERVIGNDWGANVLVCYGFLQALYVQQDAVINLCKAVGINWHPSNDPVLQNIRDLRNRLCGHPASAAQNQPASSAILGRHSISLAGFDAAIYYDTGFTKVQIEVGKIRADNESRLADQLSHVENKIDVSERVFRLKHAQNPIMNIFGPNPTYILDRIYCDFRDEFRVIQARSHIKIFGEMLDKLRTSLRERGLEKHFGVGAIDNCEVGLEMVEEIFNNGVISSSQARLTILYDDFRKPAEDVLTNARDLDGDLRDLP